MRGSNGSLIDNLKVRKPVVFALTAPRALTFQRVTLCNEYGDGDQYQQNCAKVMKVQTERDRPVDLGRQVYLAADKARADVCGGARRPLARRLRPAPRP